ncbi:MAG: NAD(P)-dependent dehydrogenase (short-subunit alcohol dehydrogenase family) [Saprospiraceae bacterium]|jgi:NAD(P)-dependent dehydrogenase (short-subunit alcohol dehydrogenase family)
MNKKSNWNASLINDLNGKVVIITGATSGLGKEATQVLAEKNATIIMAVRNVKKAEAVKNEIQIQHPNSTIEIQKLDLSSLDSIKQFSNEINNKFDRLDVLINNAGIMVPPYSTTQDGFEIQMGTNHLGPFALTGQLIPLLKKTKDSRIVSTSSIAHTQGNIDFSDLNWEKRKYKTSNAYGDSKLANLYFTYELAEKLKDDPNAPIVLAAHPGWTKTDLQKHSRVFRMLNPFFSQGVKMGVLPTLRAAFDPDAKSGNYFGPSGFMEMKGYPVKVKSNKLSRDFDLAKKLWKASEELTRIKY